MEGDCNRHRFIQDLKAKQDGKEMSPSPRAMVHGVTLLQAQPATTSDGLLAPPLGNWQREYESRKYFSQGDDPEIELHFLEASGRGARYQEAALTSPGAA